MGSLVSITGIGTPGNSLSTTHMPFDPRGCSRNFHLRGLDSPSGKGPGLFGVLPPSLLGANDF